MGLKDSPACGREVIGKLVIDNSAGGKDRFSGWATAKPLKGLIPAGKLSGPSAAGVAVAAAVDVTVVVGLEVGMTGASVLVLAADVGVSMSTGAKAAGVLVCLTGGVPGAWQAANIKEKPMIGTIYRIGFILEFKTIKEFSGIILSTTR